MRGTKLSAPGHLFLMKSHVFGVYSMIYSKQGRDQNIFSKKGQLLVPSSAAREKRFTESFPKMFIYGAVVGLEFVYLARRDFLSKPLGLISVTHPEYSGRIQYTFKMVFMGVNSLQKMLALVKREQQKILTKRWCMGYKRIAKCIVPK